MTLAAMFTVIFVLLCVGFIAWLIGKVPMNETIRQVIQGLIIFVAIVWVIWKIVLPLLEKAG